MPCSERYAQSAAKNGNCRFPNVARRFRSFPIVSTGDIFYGDVAVEWRRYVVMVSRQKRGRKFQNETSVVSGRVVWGKRARGEAESGQGDRGGTQVCGIPEQAKQNWLATSSFFPRARKELSWPARSLWQ
jgi:hypothetical protein